MICSVAGMGQWLRATSAVSTLLASGCMTQQSYEGPRLPAEDVAHISGDLRLTAGMPLSVILRKVDEHVLGFSENGVDVLPGKHTLLVDCSIRETASTSRHSLDVEVVAGARYRLVGQSAPGMRKCDAVRLEERS